EDNVHTGHGGGERFTVEDVALDETEARVRERVRQKLAPPGGEVVVRHDVVAAGEQPIDEVAADETGASGDQGFHRVSGGVAVSRPIASSMMNLGRRFVSS